MRKYVNLLDQGQELSSFDRGENEPFKVCRYLPTTTPEVMNTYLMTNGGGVHEPFMDCMFSL